MKTQIIQELSRDSLDPIPAALLVEHERLTSPYEHNVAMGDQFVAVYLAVVSLAVGLLVGVRELMPQSDRLVLIELALLMIIVVVGMITFRRLIERRIRSIEYLRAINRIHRYFVDKDPKVQLYFYRPACDDCPPMFTKGTALGGLRDIVAGLNSLFLGFAVAAVIGMWLPHAALSGVGAIVWLIQHEFSKSVLKRAERGMDRFILFRQLTSAPDD